jgi:hypothetical protein
LPAALPVQERVEFPEPPVVEVTVRVQTRLVELAITARVTVPAKPFSGATAMMEVALTPAFMVEIFGLADIVKS